MDHDEDVPMGHHETTGSSTGESIEVNGHAESTDPSITMESANIEPYDDPEADDDEDEQMIDQAMSESPPQVLGLSLAAMPGGGLNDVEDTSTSTSGKSEALRTPVDSSKPEVVIQRFADPALPYSSSRTGLVYDARMRFHTELGASEDDIHPEDPRRIWEIYNELVQAGLVEDDSEPNVPFHPFRLMRIQARLAEPAEICLVHSRKHYEWVEDLENWDENRLRTTGKKMDSVYLHSLTHYCALLSAGGAIEACRAVVAGHVKNAIAVIRPPGHHAEHDEPGGFCFFNNVCVAAKVCQNDFPEKCRKILILDWDVHHGNGIQNIFESDPNVLYISLHVHKDGKFYPNGTRGNHLHVGKGDGIGKNVNIPWPAHFMGDGDYLYAFQQVVMPISQEFNPDLVIVSAGFDAAEGDALGMCHVSPAGFAHMTHMLMSLAGGKVVACLEGGYNLRSIAKSSLAVTRTLMGEPPERIHDTEPSANGVATVQLVIGEQSRYWKSLYPKETYETRLHRMGGERLHDVLRNKQAADYWSDFRMSPLYILREKLSKSFENQVLATSDYAENKPLLVILHDPPETIGIHDPNSSKLDSHNIIVTDVAMQYVDWAVKQGFAVIDVNVPKHLTELDKPSGSSDADSLDERARTTHELVMYIWENYIEINDASHIFLLGIGQAYSGIIWGLNNLERIQERTSLSCCFLAESSLIGVSRPADDYFSSWYYNNSLVFVAENHAVWSPDRVRKVRKKYGRLVKSSSSNINDMLLEHREQVFAKILDDTESWRAERPPPQDMTRTTEHTAQSFTPSNIKDETSIPSVSPNPVKSPERMPTMGFFYTVPQV